MGGYPTAFCRLSNRILILTLTFSPYNHEQHLRNPAATIDMAPRKQKHKMPALAKQTTKHAHPSDDELFTVPAEQLKGDLLLQLAHRYSPREIFDKVNAIRPGSFKNAEIVRGRFNHAIQVAAGASGRSIADIRTEIAEARQSHCDQQEERDEQSLRRSQVNNLLPIASKPKMRLSQELAPK